MGLVWLAVGIATLNEGYIDFGDGNYMYISWRMSEGAMLYRDILSPQSKTITVDDIKRVVASHYKLASDALVSRKRTSAIAFPRQVAMYLSRMLTDLSLTDIGSAFGKRDHTTVMHACDKVREKAGSDPKFQALLDTLADQIKQAS